MFDHLEELNSDSSNLNKQHILAQFFNYKSVVKAFLKVEQLARSLNEMSVQMDDTTVITKIVSSLPDVRYQAFQKAWDSVPDKNQSMRMLMACLNKEELEQQTNLEDNTKQTEKSTAYWTDDKKKPGRRTYMYY